MPLNKNVIAGQRCCAGHSGISDRGKSRRHGLSDGKQGTREDISHKEEHINLKHRSVLFIHERKCDLTSRPENKRNFPECVQRSEGKERHNVCLKVVSIQYEYSTSVTECR